MYQDALKKKVEVTTLEANTLKAILKHKKTDPIQEFKDRYKRPGSKKRTKDSTPVKKPIGTTVKKRRKQQTNSYTENDLKLNWKTLMCFCKYEWNPEEAYPLPKAEIEKDHRDLYYIGRSDIDGKKVYFSVSEYIIPTDRDSHIFPNSFFLTMQNNKEYEIPDYSKKELYEIVQYAIRTSIDYIIPRMVEGEKKWKLRYKDGKYSKYMTKMWIDEKFAEGFDVFYDKLLSDDYLGKRIECPHDKSDEEEVKVQTGTNIPAHFHAKGKVKYCFGESAYCAFGNMANALHLLKDYKAASFFFANRFKNKAELLEKYTTLPEDQRNVNEFGAALRILRDKFGYTTKVLGMNHRPWLLYDDDKNLVKYMEFQAYESVVRHVICLFNGLIYDGTLGQPIKLSKNSMQWLSGDENFLMKTYVIEPSSPLKKQLGTKTIGQKRKK